MKKTILSIAFVAAGLFASTAFAANPNTGKNCDNCQTTCVEKGKKGPKGDKDNKGQRGQRDEMAAFEGINLTDAQKTSIKKLHADRQTAREARRQAKDSTMQRPDRRQARLDYFKAVSVILTPDQYVTFLENTAAGQPKVAKHHGQRGEKHGQKQRKGHDGKKGQARQPKTNQQS